MRLSTAGLILVPLLLNGCIDIVGNTGSGGGADGPSSTQLSELGRSFTDDLESELQSMTLVQPGGPVDITFAGACPDSSNSNDSDADGILDNATLTYAGAPCRSALWRGGTIAVTGSVRVEDPSFSNSHSYALTLTNLGWRYVNPTETLSYTATRNGTRDRTGTNDSIRVASTMTTDRERPVITAVATIDQDLVWTFVATDENSIAPDAALPDGSLRVTGDYHWIRSSENWSLDLTTPTPLVYDADCNQEQRIVSGRVRLEGTIATVPGHLDLTFTGCGAEPIRAFTKD